MNNNKVPKLNFGTCETHDSIGHMGGFVSEKRDKDTSQTKLLFSLENTITVIFAAGAFAKHRQKRAV